MHKVLRFSPSPKLIKTLHKNTSKKVKCFHLSFAAKVWSRSPQVLINCIDFGEVVSVQNIEANILAQSRKPRALCREMCCLPQRRFRVFGKRHQSCTTSVRSVGSFRSFTMFDMLMFMIYIYDNL